MTAGRPIDRPADRLEAQHGAVTGLFAALAARSDLVLVDSPPLLPVSDAKLVAPRVDSLLVVLAHERQDERTVGELRTTLERLPVNVMGCVATGVRVKAEIGYAYASYGEKAPHA